MDPDRRRIHGDPVANRSRNRRAECWRILLLKVVDPFDGYKRRDRHWHRIALTDRVVLPVELERLADGRAIHRRLYVFHDAEAILEADDGALIETEEIAGLFAEAAAFQVAVEPVRQLKVGSVNGEPERGR